MIRGPAPPTGDLIQTGTTEVPVVEGKTYGTKAMIRVRPQAGSDPEYLSRRIAERLKRPAGRCEIILDQPGNITA